MLPLLCLLISLLGSSSASTFEIGGLAIARNLKWKKSEKIRDAVNQLNNSYIKVVGHNTHLEPRRVYTIQLLRDPSVQLAVPRKKLRQLSRIMIYDYSSIHRTMMMAKFNVLIRNPLNHIIVLPFFDEKLGGMQNAIKTRYGNIGRYYNLKLSDWPLIMLLVKWSDESSSRYLGANGLKENLYFIKQNIPNVLWSPMKHNLLKWAKTQNDPCITPVF